MERDILQRTSSIYFQRFHKTHKNQTKRLTTKKQNNDKKINKKVRTEHNCTLFR